jgi:hypothetical protein
MARARIYRWVTHGNELLYQIGFNSEGSLHNPRGYPEDVVRAVLEDVERRCAERRSRAAKQAAETRQRRKDAMIWSAAKRILTGQGIGERKNCAICGRGLADPESIKRGIGSECWQAVLSAVEELKKRVVAV